MRVLLSALGSRGDLQPMAALAVRLRDAGHDVVVQGPPEQLAFMRAHGVRYVACGTGLVTALQALDLRRVSIVELVRTFQRVFHDETRAHLEASCAVLDSGIDVVVCAGLQVATAYAARVRGVPSFLAAYSPHGIPSADHAPIFLAGLRAPRWVNRVLHRAQLAFYRWTVVPALRRIVDEVGLRRPTGMHELLPERQLLAWDAALSPAPVDSAERFAACGFPMESIAHVGALQLPDAPPLDPALDAWLREGPKPVYVGFGSMPNRQVQETLSVLDVVARRLGVRVAFSPGWTDAPLGDIPASVRIVGDVAHRHLFPRCAAVVHHGGAGTVAAATRGGAPQVVIPHMLDQPWWARRLVDVGIASAAIPRARLAAPALARALVSCLEDQPLQARARALAATVNATDPLDLAAAELLRVHESTKGRPLLPGAAVRPHL